MLSPDDDPPAGSAAVARSSARSCASCSGGASSCGARSSPATGCAGRRTARAARAAGTVRTTCCPPGRAGRGLLLPRGAARGRGEDASSGGTASSRPGCAGSVDQHGARGAAAALPAGAVAPGGATGSVSPLLLLVEKVSYDNSLRLVVKETDQVLTREDRPSEASLRKKALALGSIIAFIALVVGSFFGDRGILRMVAQRERTELLRMEIEGLRAENGRLAGEIAGPEVRSARRGEAGPRGARAGPAGRDGLPGPRARRPPAVTLLSERRLPRPA